MVNGGPEACVQEMKPMLNVHDLAMIRYSECDWCPMKRMYKNPCDIHPSSSSLNYPSPQRMPVFTSLLASIPTSTLI